MDASLSGYQGTIISCTCNATGYDVTTCTCTVYGRRREVPKGSREILVRFAWAEIFSHVGLEVSVELRVRVILVIAAGIEHYGS
jgi:cytochrome c oxidase assembly protein Cox11